LSFLLLSRASISFDVSVTTVDGNAVVSTVLVVDNDDRGAGGDNETDVEGDIDSNADTRDARLRLLLGIDDDGWVNVNGSSLAAVTVSITIVVGAHTRGSFVIGDAGFVIVAADNKVPRSLIFLVVLALLLVILLIVVELVD